MAKKNLEMGIVQSAHIMFCYPMEEPKKYLILWTAMEGTKPKLPMKAKPSHFLQRLNLNTSLDRHILPPLQNLNLSLNLLNALTRPKMLPKLKKRSRNLDKFITNQ